MCAPTGEQRFWACVTRGFIPPAASRRRQRKMGHKQGSAEVEDRVPSITKPHVESYNYFLDHGLQLATASLPVQEMDADPALGIPSLRGRPLQIALFHWYSMHINAMYQCAPFAADSSLTNSCVSPFSMDPRYPRWSTDQERRLNRC